MSRALIVSLKYGSSSSLGRTPRSLLSLGDTGLEVGLLLYAQSGLCFVHQRVHLVLSKEGTRQGVSITRSTMTEHQLLLPNSLAPPARAPPCTPQDVA